MKDQGRTIARLGAIAALLGLLLVGDGSRGLLAQDETGDEGAYASAGETPASIASVTILGPETTATTAPTATVVPTATVAPTATAVPTAITAALAPTAPPNGTPAAGTPSASCHKTGLKRTQIIVTSWYQDVLGGQRPQAAKRILAEQAVLHVADGGASGQSTTVDARQWAIDQRKIFPDLRVRIDAVTIQGDRVAVYVTLEGTQQGADAVLGIPATGRHATWVGMGLFRVDCGRIAEIWSVSDNLALLRQLGVITDEELRTASPVATAAP